MIFSGLKLSYNRFSVALFILHLYYILFIFIFVFVHFFFGITQMLHLNVLPHQARFAFLHLIFKGGYRAITVLLFALCIIRIRMCTDVKMHTLFGKILSICL